MPRNVKLIYTGDGAQQVPGYRAQDIAVPEEEARELVKRSGIYRFASAADADRAKRGDKAEDAAAEEAADTAGGGE